MGGREEWVSVGGGVVVLRSEERGVRNAGKASDQTR